MPKFLLDPNQSGVYWQLTPITILVLPRLLEIGLTGSLYCHGGAKQFVSMRMGK
ncbi:hypothetical protein MHB50_10295 [Siminovitchia sp. FSL H7-0308]|uniref:hypothetical protein n=1 Tax=Siminovitchia sp. FSL H7-0308 TaxID=2921432 RepID=UPI0030ECB8AA